MADRDDEEVIGYTVAPHRHHVVLERRGDDTVLRHIATREEHALPNSDWALHFDDEGYGVLVNEVSEQVQLVEDIFLLKLVQNQYGKLEIINETGVKSKVDGHLSWYRCGNVQWPGPAGTMLEVPICKLAVPRGGTCSTGVWVVSTRPWARRATKNRGRNGFIRAGIGGFVLRASAHREGDHTECRAEG